MSQSGSVIAGTAGGSELTVHADVGTAVSVSHNINVFGSGGTTTSASGSTVTINSASSTTDTYAFTWSVGSGAGGGNPADGVTYYMQNGNDITNATASGATTNVWIPKDGTINTVYGEVTASGLGSAENITIALRLNNTINFNITTTLELNASPALFSITNLGLSVVAGDFINLLFISPTWVTNPTGVRLGATVLVS